MRVWRWVLLTTTAIVSPTLAAADPISLIGIVAGIAGSAVAGSAAVIGVIGAIGAAILGAAISLGGTLLVNALRSKNQDSGGQREERTRQFDPHPPIRFAFGEFPLEGSVVFHYGSGNVYYLTILLNSVASDSIEWVEINDGLRLTFVDDGSNDIYDMTLGAAVTAPSVFAGGIVRMWIGLGDQTAPPSTWLSEIPEVIQASDSWAGATVAHVRLVHGAERDAARRWNHGKPPPLRFLGRWAKVYDPRLDGDSGVTGASGSHDAADASTWEWSANPALCGLMLARHEYALGFDDRAIPIQQWADAADACEDAESAYAPSEPIKAFDDTWKYQVEAPGSSADYSAAAYDDSGWSTGTGGFGEDFDGNTPAANTYVSPAIGKSIWLRTVIPGGDGRSVQIDCYHDDGPQLWIDGASVALTEVTPFFRSRATIPGSASGRVLAYKVTDSVPTGNPTYIYAGLDIARVDEFSGGGLRCDGLVTIEDRELSILDPVLACMAGHLDTTDGLLGVRAGVWVAPTVTLTQPVGDEIEVLGARDAGFDTVRAKFLGRHRNWEETDGPGYALREGGRVSPLHLPLVREPEQAARLEKIAGLRAEPNRTVTATWDGREASRRVGERVNFLLPGFARATSTYLVDSKQVVWEAAEDGVALETRMTLIEDIEATYAWSDEDYTPPLGYIPPDQTVPTIAPPTNLELATTYRVAPFTEGDLAPQIRVRFEPSTSDVDYYIVEVYEPAYTSRDNDLGDRTWTYQVDPDSTIDDGGTIKLESFAEPVIVGLEYRVRVWSFASGLGQSDTYLEGFITVGAFDTDLGAPTLLSSAHDEANTAMHTIRAPDSPDVRQLRLYVGDESDRSDLTLLDTVTLGSLASFAFVDPLSFAPTRYYRAVAVDQFGVEGAALDFEYTPGAATTGREHSNEHSAEHG